MKLALSLIIFSSCSLISVAQESTPKFTDYPARVTRTKSRVKVKTYSTPDTRCYRTMLRNTVRRGERFAGHYALSYWGCGTNCARVGIVDLLTGRAYVSPFYISIAGGGENFHPIKTQPDSRLILINDPVEVRKGYGDVPPEFEPSYFLWNGRHLLPVQNGKIGREPKRAFNQCSDE